MTRRDGDAIIKMTRSDRSDSVPTKYSIGGENGSDSKSSTAKHPVTDSISSRPRSASNSLPGSRASSRPGSQMTSRANSQESIIDLFDCMTLALGQNGHEGKGIHLKYPKPRLLSQPRWSWADKLRINSAIWRSWHIQFVKNKKPIGCHFDPQLPETRRPTLQADAIQSGRGTTGSIQYNQSQVGSVLRDYRKWRLYHLDLSTTTTIKPPVASSSPPVDNAEENAIDLNMSHPPLSPMSACTLANEDTLKDFSDTLFISKKKHFSVPHPKKITRHVYNADVIQPGLMQLEPDFDDDFMDTLDSIQDTLSKTPTKFDLRSLIEFPDSIINSDNSMSAFNDSMSLGTFTTVNEERPVSSNPSTCPYFVTGAPNPATASRSLSFPTLTSSSTQHWPQVSYQGSSNQTKTSNYPSTTSSSYGQMPPIFEAVASGPGVTAMQVDSSAMYEVSAMTTGSTVYHTSQPLKQEPPSPTMVKNQQCLNSGVDINDAIYMLAAQLQQQQQQSAKQQEVGYNWNLPSEAQPAAGVGSNETFWRDGAMQGNPDVQVSEPYSNLPQSVPSTGVNWSFAGGSSDVSVTNGVFPQGIMSQGGLSSTNAAFIKNAGGLPHGIVLDTMAPMDQNVVFGAMYATPHNTPSPGNTTPGHVTSGRRTPGQVTPVHVTPGYRTPGHGTPGHGTPGHVTPGHVTPGYGTPGHVTPGHVTPGHVTPGHVTPGHVTPGHVTPGYVTPGHVTPGHVTPGHMTPYLAESMEFEQYSYHQIPKTTASTSSSYKIKRERSHSRKNSNERSPRVSQTVVFADSASYAAYMGKSETKDLGKPEARTETNLSPLLLTSHHPSTASSAASSPGSMTEGTEFDFPTPQAKRRKTPDSSGEKETRRRYKHLQSEHKRRFNIQSGLDEIQRVVPSLRNATESNKSSTAGMLQKAHEHIVTMKHEVEDLRNTSDKLKGEVLLLKKEIDTYQDELPDSGAPVNTQSDRQLKNMMETYLHKRMKKNWRFWIFSLIVRPLFDTYMMAVSSSQVSDFDRVVHDWSEECCRLKPLRKLVTSALTDLSRDTSILMEPGLLQTEIQELIAKETNQNSHLKT
ncbi:uncharacterized protein LOC117298436 [Asterias rubens]|uniref:uncharacterized protein LOC117298436 n=1 Tax=Asterias rubens TaxID=7604 RepID=UPI001455B450|nr:uncharacterized protein LOC117298436 [Asterias rubens]